MKITNIDRATARVIRDKLQAAMTEVEEELGIKVKFGNARFTRQNLTFTKVEVYTQDKDGTVKTKGRAALELLYPQLVDMSYTLSNGIAGKVIEYNHRAHRYPFVVKTAKGNYKVAASALGV